MFNYQGIRCPYCGEEFRENDDIAVCPECGTPHHRQCYHEHGRCFNADLHSQNYEWKPPVSSATVNTASKLCPYCSNPITENDFFCPHCGKQVPQNLPDYNLKNLLDMQEEERKRIAEETGRFVLKSEDLIEGVSVKELLMYFKNIEYVAIFCKQEFTDRKISFCLPALFSPSLFFLYNKAWIEGICAFIISLILSIPDGMIVLYRMTGTLFMNIPLGTWDNLSNIFSFISMGVNSLFAIYGFYILRQSGIRKIKKIKAQSKSEEEFKQLIDRASPPSKLVIALIVGYIAFLFLSFLLL